MAVAVEPSGDDQLVAVGVAVLFEQTSRRKREAAEAFQVEVEQG